MSSHGASVVDSVVDSLVVPVVETSVVVSVVGFSVVVSVSRDNLALVLTLKKPHEYIFF